MMEGTAGRIEGPILTRVFFNHIIFSNHSGRIAIIIFSIGRNNLNSGDSLRIFNSVDELIVKVGGVLRMGSIDWNGRILCVSYVLNQTFM